MASTDDPMDPANVESGTRMNTLSVTHRAYRVLWTRCQKAEAELDGFKSIEPEYGETVGEIVQRELRQTAVKQLVEVEFAADQMADAIELFTDPDNPGSLVEADAQLAAALAEYRPARKETTNGQ